MELEQQRAASQRSAHFVRPCEPSDTAARPDRGKSWRSSVRSDSCARRSSLEPFAQRRSLGGAVARRQRAEAIQRTVVLLLEARTPGRRALRQLSIEHQVALGQHGDERLGSRTFERRGRPRRRAPARAGARRSLDRAPGSRRGTACACRRRRRASPPGTRARPPRARRARAPRRGAPRVATRDRDGARASPRRACPERGPPPSARPRSSSDGASPARSPPHQQLTEGVERPSHLQARRRLVLPARERRRAAAAPPRPRHRERAPPRRARSRPRPSSTLAGSRRSWIAAPSSSRRSASSRRPSCASVDARLRREFDRARAGLGDRARDLERLAKRDLGAFEIGAPATDQADRVERLGVKGPAWLVLLEDPQRLERSHSRRPPGRRARERSTRGCR